MNYKHRTDIWFRHSGTEYIKLEIIVLDRYKWTKETYELDIHEENVF